MSDSKVTSLPLITTLAGVDRLHIIDDPSGTPTNKGVTLNLLFGAVPCNTSVSGTLVVSANTTLNGRQVNVTANSNYTGDIHFRRAVNIVNTTIRIANSSTPANSTQTFGGKGSIRWDSSYLYIETANSTIKRVALSSF